MGKEGFACAGHNVPLGADRISQVSFPWGALVCWVLAVSSDLFLCCCALHAYHQCILMLLFGCSVFQSICVLTALDAFQEQSGTTRQGAFKVVHLTTLRRDVSCGGSPAGPKRENPVRWSSNTPCGQNSAVAHQV